MFTMNSKLNDSNALAFSFTIILSEPLIKEIHHYNYIPKCVQSFHNNEPSNVPDIGLTGDTPWAPPLSPSSGYSGDKLDPSKADKQPKTHYLLFITEGQYYLNRQLYHFIPMATVINIILLLELFDNID